MYGKALVAVHFDRFPRHLSWPRAAIDRTVSYRGCTRVNPLGGTGGTMIFKAQGLAKGTTLYSHP